MGLSETTKSWEASGRYVEAEGMRIFTYEKGTGPALFLLHGFPTSCYDWRAMMDILAPAFRCVAFDFPGYGLSDKPAAYSYSLFQQADVAEGVAKALGIESAHVVSHDVGTSVHCELLARDQEGRLGFDLDGSTFLNGSMLQWLATITPFQKLLANNESLPQAIEICDNMSVGYVDGLKSVMARRDCITDEDAQVMTELLAHNQGNRRLPALSIYMRERYINRERWIGALKATERPIQFVWADSDPVANVALGHALRDEVPQARYTELAGLGHFLVMEDPATVAAAVKAFVE